MIRYPTLTNDPSPHRQFHTLPSFLDSLAALPNSNPNACMPMQGGSLYHFYDGLWYDSAGTRTNNLPCERRTDTQNRHRYNPNSDLFISHITRLTCCSVCSICCYDLFFSHITRLTCCSACSICCYDLFFSHITRLTCCSACSVCCNTLICCSLSSTFLRHMSSSWCSPPLTPPALA